MTHAGPSPLRLVAGFVVWGSCLVALYALHAIGCHLGWDGRTLGPLPLDRSVLVLAWIAHLGAFTPLLRPGAAEPWARVHRAAAVAAFAATVWTGIPVAVLETCR